MEYVKFNGETYSVYNKVSPTEWVLHPETEGSIITVNPQDDSVQLL